MRQELLEKHWWLQQWWIGVFGGFLAWYMVHEFGFFYSDYNCRHRWILPTIHVIGIIAGFACVWLSYQAMKMGENPASTTARKFMAKVGVGAASIFSLVIVWQTVAAIIYSGCER